MPPRNIAKHPKAAGPRPGVIFLADVREKDVADLVLAVKGDQEASVADRDVAGHGILSKRGPGVRAERRRLCVSLLSAIQGVFFDTIFG